MSLKSYINHFNAEFLKVSYALDVGVLAHLTSGVLPKIRFWDDLQDKDCKTLPEFYRMAGKYLRIENIQEALDTAKDFSIGKKNDKKYG